MQAVTGSVGEQLGWSAVRKVLEWQNVNALTHLNFCMRAFIECVVRNTPAFLQLALSAHIPEGAQNI